VRRGFEEEQQNASRIEKARNKAEQIDIRPFNSNYIAEGILSYQNQKSRLKYR
jgi:hypothetical protein